tara:strand:- start:24 stop:389 length:366 start_codon:yes stop_codon:yes gene_type:complete
MAKPSKDHRFVDHTSGKFDYFLYIHAGVHGDEGHKYVDGTKDEGIIGTSEDDYYRHWQKHLKVSGDIRYKNNASNAHKRSGVMDASEMGKRLFFNDDANKNNRKIRYGGAKGLKSNRERKR